MQGNAYLQPSEGARWWPHLGQERPGDGTDSNWGSAGFQIKERDAGDRQPWGPLGRVSQLLQEQL